MDLNKIWSYHQYICFHGT